MSAGSDPLGRSRGCQRWRPVPGGAAPGPEPCRTPHGPHSRLPRPWAGSAPGATSAAGPSPPHAASPQLPGPGRSLETLEGRCDPPPSSLGILDPGDSVPTSKNPARESWPSLTPCNVHSADPRLLGPAQQAEPPQGLGWTHALVWWGDRRTRCPTTGPLHMPAPSRECWPLLGFRPSSLAV